MTRALMLVAAMALAACHSRTDEEVGAAPDADTTDPATHVIDPERTGPPGVGGRPPGSTITLDSVLPDTAEVRRDTTFDRGAPTPISDPQDTLGPGRIDSSYVDTLTPRDWSDTAR